MTSVSISLDSQYFKKDPQSTDLGKEIIRGAIKLIDELGFEQFTFKKLAEDIESTEASVYRYFGNKQTLLLYISAWYWTWIEYAIDIKTLSASNSREKLNIALSIICLDNGDVRDITELTIDINQMRRIVFHESDKTYMTKKVDEINSQGLFKDYKSLCHKLASLINEINPNYAFAHSLVSTVMEAVHQQAFFAMHIPSLSDIKKESNDRIDEQVLEFIKDLINRIIN